MLKLAKMRSNKDRFRGLYTIHNYNSCLDSIILDSHERIQEEIVKLLNNIKIKNIE